MLRPLAGRRGRHIDTHRCRPPPASPWEATLLAVLWIGLSAGCAACAAGSPAAPAASENEIDLTRPRPSSDNGWSRAAPPDEQRVAGPSAESAQQDRAAADPSAMSVVVERVLLPAPADASPSRGPAAAPVTIQVFSDFECPFCRLFVPTLDALEQEFSTQIRVVWRNLPMPFHSSARPAAAAAWEAFTQQHDAGFWRMHDALFASADAPDAFMRESLERLAAQLKLDLPSFRQALDHGTHEAAIDRDLAMAEAAGISATPSVAINHYLVVGAQPLAAFRTVVQLALKELKANAANAGCDGDRAASTRWHYDRACRGRRALGLGHWLGPAFGPDCPVRSAHARRVGSSAADACLPATS